MNKVESASESSAAETRSLMFARAQRKTFVLASDVPPSCAAIVAAQRVSRRPGGDTTTSRQPPCLPLLFP